MCFRASYVTRIDELNNDRRDGFTSKFQQEMDGYDDIKVQKIPEGYLSLYYFRSDLKVIKRVVMI